MIVPFAVPVTKTPPMPDIQEALVYSNDLKKACQRLDDCWNKTQLQDALRSIKYYVEEMEKHIK